MFKSTEYDRDVRARILVKMRRFLSRLKKKKKKKKKVVERK